MGLMCLQAGREGLPREAGAAVSVVRGLVSASAYGWMLQRKVENSPSPDCRVPHLEGRLLSTETSCSW